MATVEEKADNVVSFFARHLVSIFYVVEGMNQSGEWESGTDSSWLASGFILSIRGFWFYVTAGHVVEQLNESLSRNALQVCRLLDGMGAEATNRTPIPLAYQMGSGVKMYEGGENDTGIDYGIIKLGGLVRQCLEKNRIVPIHEGNWRLAPADFDKYALIGTPASGLTLNKPKDDEFPLPARITPTVTFVEPVKEPPAEIVKPFNRFYARVSGDLDIKGMSGGPLFGLTHRNGEMKYWTVGIQSGWHRPTRILAACPLKYFAEKVEEVVETVLGKSVAQE